MKQKTLYIILALSLVIIIVLLTILITKKDIHHHSSQKHLNHPDNSNIIINTPINYSRYSMQNDIDYAYDYDGYWFQPSRWWNNLWQNRRLNMYNRHDNYDRHDGLDKHNRYINIHNNNNINPNPNPQTGPITNSNNIQPVNSKESSTHIISLLKPESGSVFPLPTLISSSSTPMMPEEISMSPMAPISQMSHSEHDVQSISTFVSNVPASYSSYKSSYVSNFDYKGSDSKNQKPLPVDMMASESIYLQPNTIANEIIKPNIAMQHPN